MTLPSESVLHAFMTSFDAEYSSKLLGLPRSVVTSRTWMFSSGMIPLGSLSWNTTKKTNTAFLSRRNFSETIPTKITSYTTSGYCFNHVSYMYLDDVIH